MILLSGAVFLVDVVVLQYICNAASTPFIDEIFHIPQAQKYCNGTFSEWDHKITTPPGLYFVSFPVQWLLGSFSETYNCSVTSLRFVNVIFHILNFLLASRIMRVVHSDQKKLGGEEGKQSSDGFVLQSLTISIFPILYFFSFLYYTDPGSTTFVLAAYLANLKSLHKTSALLGLASLFFRQTNIVWVAFMAGSTVAAELIKVSDIEKIEASKDIKDKLARFLANIIAAVAKYLIVVSNLLRIGKLVWPYVVTMALFCMFVLVNGGIVVGDRTNHEVTFHGSQLLYFLGVTLCFASPLLLSPLKIMRFVGSVKKAPQKYVSFGVLFFIFIVKYTHIHLFLLSDNRHYVFYVWRYALRHQFVRVALIPVYLYAGWAINDSLDAPHCTGIWKLVYIICCCAATLPQKLIEPRYFIIPYLIYRMNVNVTDKKVAVLEFLLHFCINALTVIVFSHKTFAWSDIAEPQRIIW